LLLHELLYIMTINRDKQLVMTIIEKITGITKDSRSILEISELLDDF